MLSECANTLSRKMMDKAIKAMAQDIEQHTQQGSHFLQSGCLKQALESFQMAYNGSQQLEDGFVKRACAFNLGAVYIAQRNPEKGLEMLNKAIPPVNCKDSKSNGDLFFNFGLAYEIEKKEGESVKYMELALEEYQVEGNTEMEADTAKRIGALYLKLQRPLQAARVYGIAAASCSRQGKLGEQCMVVLQQAAALQQAGKVEDAQTLAGDCMALCQHVKDSAQQRE